MDEFINSLNIARFESTNGLWNDLMLNDPWSVGYVTNLIETTEFRNKEEWEEFYYNSGENRDAELCKLSPELKEKLDNEQLILKNKNEIADLSKDLKNLNFNFGRTKLQIKQKGKILYQSAIKKGIDITETECAEAVRFRTICQTWNGVVIRERKTINLLKQNFSELNFQKTNGHFDYEYAVDYQAFKGNVLICGIQIKPASYTRSNATYVIKAKSANKRKNEKYTEKFKVPVFDIFFEKGQILNSQVLRKIKEIVFKNKTNPMIDETD